MSTDTTTRTEQVQAQEIKQGDLLQMGIREGRAFYREVFRAEVCQYQTTGRRVLLTVSDSGPKGEQTMVDLLPFLTLTRMAV